MQPRRDVCPARRALGFSSGALLVLGLAGGCQTETTPAAPPCCEQPAIPAGVVPFTVVAEEATGPSDGQKVILRAALGRPAKRDEIYPILHTLYRHAMKRGAFEPIQLLAEVYPSEASARAAGDGQLLARISREQTQLAPVCDNRVPYDFGEQVGRAFAASMGRAPEEKMEDTCRLDPPKEKPRFDDAFTHKASFTLDAQQKTVLVTYPYLEMGKDEYVPELKLTTALTYWTEMVTSLFGKVPDLRSITFEGVHGDAQVLRIALTRPQFDSEIRNLQEAIASHAAVTFQSLGTGRASDKSAAAEQEQFKLKTYREALAGLPRNQVTIAPTLAKGSIKLKGAEPPGKKRGKKARRS